ncbi:MAG: DUF2254 domain-containing protein [Ramlibacter sp.]
MNARLRKLLGQLGESFWLIPAALVLAGTLLGVLMLRLDRGGLVPRWLIESDWVYNGGGTGARTLLGVIASSTIGVAGTVFSITIAALSLAAGQMGPRLLRNFTRDRGNQITLGAFLGTFAYALTVLRSVRTQDEGIFTPHLALTAGMALAFACVGLLVYFVGHMASRISVDTVIDLVSTDIRKALDALVETARQPGTPPDSFWAGATPVPDPRQGYLQQLDENALADWAAAQGTALRLLVRRGSYVFPGAPIAVMTVNVPGAQEAILRATALGDNRGSTGDAEHAIRQLVEVAVRALSPGINDPNTAVSVLDRLGAALCGLAGRQLPNGVAVRDGRVVLVVPHAGYEGFVNVMFHMIRQNAARSTAVMISLLDVLTAVIVCEPDVQRRAVLLHHADLVWADAQREIANAGDLADIGRRRALLQRTMEQGVLGAMGATGR